MKKMNINLTQIVLCQYPDTFLLNIKFSILYLVHNLVVSSLFDTFGPNLKLFLKIE